MIAPTKWCFVKVFAMKGYAFVTMFLWIETKTVYLKYRRKRCGRVRRSWRIALFSFSYSYLANKMLITHRSNTFNTFDIHLGTLLYPYPFYPLSTPPLDGDSLRVSGPISSFTFDCSSVMC